MTGICNYNCNFDMNMSLKNVENSVSRILTEKEIVYHQRLEEMENRLPLEAALNTSRPTLVMNMLLNGPATLKRWTIDQSVFQRCHDVK
jgi:hypothetical protein